MNTRLNTIYKEATGKDWAYDFDPEIAEKFAQLIVNKCADIINKDCELQHTQGVIANLGGLNQARELIKEYFGVDE